MAHRRADLRSTGRRFSAGENHEANALTFAFRWKAFLGAGTPRTPPAQILVPLEGPPAQEALRKTHPRKYVFQRNALFCKSASRRRCAQTSPPLEGVSRREDRPLEPLPLEPKSEQRGHHFSPRLSAGVDSNRAAPRGFSSTTSAAAPFAARTESKRNPGRPVLRLNLPATRCHQRSSGWQRARRQRRQRRQATPSW